MWENWDGMSPTDIGFLRSIFGHLYIWHIGQFFFLKFDMCRYSKAKYYLCSAWLPSWFYLWCCKRLWPLVDKLCNVSIRGWRVFLPSLYFLKFHLLDVINPDTDIRGNYSSNYPCVSLFCSSSIKCECFHSGLLYSNRKGVWRMCWFLVWSPFLKPVKDLDIDLKFTQ